MNMGTCRSGQQFNNINLTVKLSIMEINIALNSFDILSQVFKNIWLEKRRSEQE